MNIAEITNTSQSLNAFSKALDGKTDDWQTTDSIHNQSIRLTFSGSGRDYLSLWLTNWILTILTLGIYSAWAKVRRLQYIHQNTQLAGYAFGFHGQATSILIGRIIGISLIILSSLADFINSTASIVIALSGAFSLLFSLAFPWFYRASIRFYNRNSSYRNVRFKFVGSNKEIYWCYFLTGLLWLPTLGMIYPYFAYRIRKYRVENSLWGNNAFRFHAHASSFYSIYVLHAMLTIILLITATILLSFFNNELIKNIGEILSNNSKNENEFIFTLIYFAALLTLIFFIVYRLTHVITQDMIFKKVWNSTSIDKSHFTCDLSVIRLYGLRLLCLLLSLITLGFFIPYAKMLILKRRIESLTLIPAHDFDLMQAILDTDTTRSAEVADILDIDIGW